MDYSKSLDSLQKLPHGEHIDWPKPIIPLHHQMNALSLSHESKPNATAPDYLKLILNARVYDVAIETPLQPAKNLST
jgi:hypothetical protein